MAYYSKEQQTGRKRKIKVTTADKWFSKYIRIRDIISGEYCRCITCGKIINWKYEADCGHYATRDKPMTRFNEQNCHAQCKWCNGDHGKKGEQTKHGFAIDDMYGEGTARKLIELSELRGQSPYEDRSLKEISKEYRIKAQKLAKEKGVEL